MHSVDVCYMCQLLLGAVDNTAQVETGVPHAPLERAVSFISSPLEPAPGRMFPSPSMSTGLFVQTGGTISPALGGGRGAAPGCFLGATPVWGQLGPHDAPFPWIPPVLVLEAPGTSEHLFTETDTEDTQGTAQLG